MGDGMVGGDLATLRDLHKGLVDHAGMATDMKTKLDGHVNNAVWKGKNADDFRAAWEEFKPALEKLHHALDKGAQDVKGQHNNIALATGAGDRI